ncbi:elongation factor 1-gamma-like [Glandiceps talaboti]
MAAGTLYTYPDNFRAYKVQIAAEYSGTRLKVVSEPPEFKLGETNKSDAFLSKFPVGKVPAYEAADGTCLSESNAIAYYVANETLRGANCCDQAQVLQWVNFADSEILPAAATWVFPTLGIMQYNKQNSERAKDDVKKILNVLNEHLKTRTYLVGERVTLADITTACNLLMLYRQVLDGDFRKAYCNVNRWFTTLINQKEFKTVIGDVQLCEKMAQFDAKKFKEMQGAGEDKKEKKKKEEKKQQPKKHEKKQKPEAEEKDEDDVPKEPKKKDPYADLPPSKFDMDAWKRCYSNNDTITVAIPYFWEHIDKEGYSFWFCEYDYAKDLERVFQSCNLIGGMFQRLDKLRKTAFASVLLFGEDFNSTISGVWLMRGQTLAFELNEDWTTDSASYTWTKMNPDDPKDKKKIEDYFSWEGDFDGKKLNQGKVFK